MSETVRQITKIASSYGSAVMVDRNILDISQPMSFHAEHNESTTKLMLEGREVMIGSSRRFLVKPITAFGLFTSLILITLGGVSLTFVANSKALASVPGFELSEEDIMWIHLVEASHFTAGFGPPKLFASRSISADATSKQPGNTNTQTGYMQCRVIPSMAISALSAGQIPDKIRICLGTTTRQMHCPSASP